VEALGQHPRHRGLADAPVPAEDIAVRQPPLGDGIAQGAHDGILPNHILKVLRPVTACNNRRHGVSILSARNSHPCASSTILSQTRGWGTGAPSLESLQVGESGPRGAAALGARDQTSFGIRTAQSSPVTVASFRTWRGSRAALPFDPNLQPPDQHCATLTPASTIVTLVSLPMTSPIRTKITHLRT